MAVTTFFHVHEVQDIVEPYGIETVALLAEANIESLRRLTELRRGPRSGSSAGAGRAWRTTRARWRGGPGSPGLPVRRHRPEQHRGGPRHPRRSSGGGVRHHHREKLRELGVTEDLEIIEEDRPRQGRHRDASAYAPPAAPPSTPCSVGRSQTAPTLHGPDVEAIHSAWAPSSTTASTASAARVWRP